MCNPSHSLTSYHFDTIYRMEYEELNGLDDAELDELISEHTVKEPDAPVKNDKASKVVSWEAPEYDHYKKEPNWFWALGIITVGLAVIAFILNNPLFAIMVVVGSFTIALFAARTPDMVLFEINEQGVKADKQLYPHDQLKSFRVIKGEAAARLLLKSKRAVMPLIAFTIPLEIADKIKESLNLYLPEGAIQEPIAHSIFDRLGF